MKVDGLVFVEGEFEFPDGDSGVVDLDPESNDAQDGNWAKSRSREQGRRKDIEPLSGRKVPLRKQESPFQVMFQ